MSVKLEAEAAQLPEADRAEMMEGLGLGEGALPRVAQAAYRMLGRRTFFTTGDKESRAWTFRAGAKAPECAGVIHSDLQRGFIRAEVVHWDELLSWARGPPPATSASSGSKARSTKSWTAMSSRSASTSERAGEAAPARDGRVVVVATPIGNLGDLSPRAVDALASSDYIYCEDTRRALKLFSHAAISGPRLVSHHRLNEAATTPAPSPGQRPGRPSPS